MTSEQMQSVRAERWRQKSNPVLTAEDAKAWVDDIGLCLFLPRRQFLAAAPSFVEAVLGAPSEAPGREAMENATMLMRRLAADAALVPLNLFGSSGLGGPASDQPDFVCSRATLPYVFSLIGGRNWKSGPGMKASPLMTEIWTLLNDGQSRTAGEIQAALGRELTEAAVLRALAELWNGLRALPAYDGDWTRWGLTQARFAAEMAASQKVAQTTALSALVSLYLDGAVAASSEEIETFLSPLTARSRVREVVNGLSATRQLGLISVGAQPLLHVAGALPEFAEEEPSKAEVEPRKARQERTKRRSFEGRPHPERSGAEERRRPERRERPFSERQRPAARRELNKEHSGERRERPPEGGGRFQKRERPERREGRPEGGRFTKGKLGDSGRRGERLWHGREERPWENREERPQKREDHPARGGGKQSFRERREEGRGGGKPFRGKKEFGGAKKFGGREKPQFFPKRAGEARRPFRERDEEQRGGGKFGGRKFGDRVKPRFSREPRSEGERRPEREGGAKKFSGGKAFGGGKPRYFRDRAGEGEGRPERGSGARPGGSRGKAGFGNSGRPAFRGEGKRGFSKERRPFGKPGGNYAKKPGKGGFGKQKPGGFKPPFRKRKKQEGEE